jgi:hypothetical protein
MLSIVPPNPNPSAWLSERNIWLPVCKPVTGPLAKEVHDAEDPDDSVNVNIPVIFPDVSSVRLALNVVSPGGYRVDCVEPVHEAF